MLRRALRSSSARIGSPHPVRGQTCCCSTLTVEDEIGEANKRCSGIVSVQGTADRGWGLRAERSIQKSEFIFGSRALSVIPERNDHSIQTGWTTHVIMDLPGRFINHSCDANVGIKDNDLGAFDFFAICDIKKGDELLWDYETSEYLSVSVPTCLCGSPKCRGGLKGFKYNSNVIKEQYGNYYPQYLRTSPPA
jgi:hypothetical protein